MAFLVERLLEDAYGVVVPEGFGVAARGPIRGDFIMLDALRGGDKRRVERFATLSVVETTPRVLDQGGDGAAWNRARRLVQLLEKQPQPFNLDLCFRTVIFEHPLQARGGCPARHH